MSPELSPCLAAALRCAAKGWPVLPLRGKLPATVHGCKDATTDRGVVAEWWRRDPEANLGIATGTRAGVWVLDLDLHDPTASGLVSMQALEGVHGPLPDTLTVRTGTGGLHMYWRMPQDRKVRNRAAIRAGIDARGDGGYVVAPPSVHPTTGTTYEVPDLGRHPVVDAPLWLLDLVAPLAAPRNPAPPAPTGIRLPPGEYDREASRRLKSDPGTRERAALALGGVVAGGSAKGIRCPQCQRPSVWWPIIPDTASQTARCHHLNSCGWWGRISDLLGGIG